MQGELPQITFIFEAMKDEMEAADWSFGRMFKFLIDERKARMVKWFQICYQKPKVSRGMPGGHVGAYSTVHVHAQPSHQPTNHTHTHMHTQCVCGGRQRQGSSGAASGGGAPLWGPRAAPAPTGG